MFRAHTGAGHRSHLPLGSARAPEAQNNADPDSNELVFFSAGKRAEEKGGPGRLWGPWPCSEDCAHVQDKVEDRVHAVPGASAHLAALHLLWRLQGHAWRCYNHAW